MNCQKLEYTKILSYNIIHRILQRNYNDADLNINIENKTFLVGNHLINNNHWIAFIVNLKKHVFYFIDPMGDDDDLMENRLLAWSEYYSKRADAENISWQLNKVNHPIQQDSFSCGQLICIFIEQIVQNGSIVFNLLDLGKHREQIVDLIVVNSDL